MTDRQVVITDQYAVRRYAGRWRVFDTHSRHFALTHPGYESREECQAMVLRLNTVRVPRVVPRTLEVPF